ncbi:MAG: peptidylprolyl isomerase, partial [Nitrososphaerota archaeon]|nr:peptidylprolyl isomerase [Nitrososphaerota archaeon]
MSKAPKRGTRRNPPRARTYATIAGVVVVLLVIGAAAYIYATRPPASSSASGGFSNPACTSSSTSATTSGSSNEFALICTNQGLIVVELYPQYAPKTVANFVSLANSGFYADLVFHRIVPSFVIQVGDPTTKDGGGNRSTWGQGTSGTSIPFENATELSNTVGSVAMASTGAGVGGSSQFYINLADNSASLNGKYTVFGQVISGMSVVNALAKVPLVDLASCQSASPTATACEPANAASAY